MLSKCTGFMIELSVYHLGASYIAEQMLNIAGETASSMNKYLDREINLYFSLWIIFSGLESLHSFPSELCCRLLGRQWCRCCYVPFFGCFLLVAYQRLSNIFDTLGHFHRDNRLLFWFSIVSNFFLLLGLFWMVRTLVMNGHLWTWSPLW